MTDMEGFVCVRLGELDHDLFSLGHPAAKIGASCQHIVHNTPGEISWGEVQVQVTFDGLDAAEASREAHLPGDGSGDLLGALGHDNLFPSPSFSGSQLKERSPNA